MWSFFSIRPEASISRTALAKTGDAGGVLRAGAQILLLPAADVLRVEAHALFHRQRAHALWAVQLVGADGVHVRVGKVKGLAQKALHAVHMDEGAARDGAFQALDVQKRTGLVVDLHAAYEAGAVVQGFFQRFIVERALFVHGKHAHLVAHFAQALKGGQHRGMFRGVDGHELFAVHALHRAEDGEVVGLRAAGGEDEFFPRRAQLFQNRLAAGAHLPEGCHPPGRRRTRGCASPPPCTVSSRG